MLEAANSIHWAGHSKVCYRHIEGSVVLVSSLQVNEGQSLTELELEGTLAELLVEVSSLGQVLRSIALIRAEEQQTLLDLSDQKHKALPVFHREIQVSSSDFVDHVGAAPISRIDLLEAID